MKQCGGEPKTLNYFVSKLKKPKAYGKHEDIDLTLPMPFSWHMCSVLIFVLPDLLF